MAPSQTASVNTYPSYQESFFIDKYSLSLTLVFTGLIRFKICAIVVVICSLVMLALRDLNFCTRSFVVIGLRIKYRRTASSVMPSLLALQSFYQLRSQQQTLSVQMQHCYWSWALQLPSQSQSTNAFITLLVSEICLLLHDLWFLDHQYSF